MCFLGPSEFEIKNSDDPSETETRVLKSPTRFFGNSEVNSEMLLVSTSKLEGIFFEESVYEYEVRSNVVILLDSNGNADRTT